MNIKNEFRHLLPSLTYEQLAGLELDILKNGCLQPLITWNGILIDGHHRYDICQKHNISFETKEMQFESEYDALYWCWINQKNRRNLSAYEAGRLALMFEPAIKKESKERQGARTDIVPTLAQSETGKSRDKVAEIAGLSHGTIDKIKTIEASASPELKQQLQTQEISINHAYKQVKTEEKKKEFLQNLENNEIKKEKEIKGLYDVIVIDPPWKMEKIQRKVAPNQIAFDYSTMELEEIEKLIIPCAENCHIWLWTTQKYLPDAFKLLEKWNLKYVCTFVWHKNGGFQAFGLPQYNCEFALYARKGTPPFIDLKSFFTCFKAERTGHSKKPNEFYDTVRRVTAGRRLDMFNRRQIEGFDTWGYESK
jgi:N6-adenosine-specific RNA methylase IME4